MQKLIVSSWEIKFVRIALSRTAMEYKYFRSTKVYLIVIFRYFFLSPLKLNILNESEMVFKVNLTTIYVWDICFFNANVW